MSVADLNEWLKENRLRVFTLPAIDEFDFVQVESLLSAVERAAGDITDAEAREIVSVDPFLSQDRMAIAAPRWLLSAEAHRKWRIKITHALIDGQLTLLDFGSKLPVPLPAEAIAAAAEFGPTAAQLAAGIYTPARLSPAELLATNAKAVVTSVASDAGLSKRERQIQAIEASAQAAGYDPLNIPDGGKTKLRGQCMESRPDLFGAGETPFNGAWKDATEMVPPRIRMANHNKYAGR